MSDAALQRFSPAISATYPATPQYECSFEPREFWVRNETVDDCEIMVSTDGQNDHLSLKTGYSNQYGTRDGMADDVRWPARARKLWFRAVPPGPTMGTPVIAVMATDMTR